MPAMSGSRSISVCTGYIQNIGYTVAPSVITLRYFGEIAPSAFGPCNVLQGSNVRVQRSSCIDCGSAYDKLMSEWSDLGEPMSECLYKNKMFRSRGCNPIHSVFTRERLSRTRRRRERL